MTRLSRLISLVHQASSLKLFPEILTDDLACGPGKVITPVVDVDGWPGWGNGPKFRLRESADDGREVSVVGDSILELRQRMIQRVLSWRDSPMLFIVGCKSVEFGTVSGDDGWQYVKAYELGASFKSWHRKAVPTSERLDACAQRDAVRSVPVSEWSHHDPCFFRAEFGHRLEN